MDNFWKHSDCDKATKIRIYDSVIKSKLLYGLHTASLTKAMQTRLNSFQLKALRQILGMDTTWAQKKRNEDMSNTMEEIIWRASEELNRHRVARLEEFNWKYREHSLGIKKNEYEDVTPPKQLWKSKKIKLAS